MSDEPDESGEWQVVTIGVSRKGEMYTNAPDDEDGANPCRDAKIFAEFTKLICFCSEPVVFAIELERKLEGDQVVLLQKDLREALNTAAQRMKENNIKKMMVYYAGHGESINKERTASCELKLVLEDEVVRAVELAELEYVCAIALLDCCRDKLYKSFAQAVPPDQSPRNTYLFGYFCHFGHRIRTSSLVPAALMHMMLSEKEDCEIAMFFTRLEWVLRDITGGRTNMQLAGPLQSRAADQDFFPAKCIKLKLPFERAKARRVLEDEEYEALRDTFAIYGHCDCIMDNAYETGVILQAMFEDTKQMVEQDGESHVPASKHTLRHLIPQLQRIAKVFHKKKELFHSDWKQELEVVGFQEPGRTSFQHVLEKLEKVTEDSVDLGPGSSRPRIPEVVRRCVVEARHRYFSQEGEMDLMTCNHVQDVLEFLSTYFTQLPPLKSASCVLKDPADSDDSEQEDFTVPDDSEEDADFIYKLTIQIDAWYVDGISASSVTEEQWAQLQKRFTKDDATNEYETKIYIGAGSIWIMLQLPTLDDRTIRSIHKELEAWTQMLRQSGAAWHAARLQKVPRAAVPGGLLKLVRELGAANLATGPVVKLTADHVRELLAKRRGVSPSRLHVFEGERSARGWLQRGDLRFTEAKDWKVLMQDINPSLSESLQTLAERTVGRQLWGDSAEFQGAAFLLHHRRAHLSAAQMGEVKCPEEFLIWVIQQELTLCCAQATPSSCWGGTLSMNNLLLSPEAEVPALAPPAWLASEGRGNFFTTAPWPASSASGLELRTATLPRDLAVVDLCELPGPKLLSCFAFQDGRCSLPGGDLQIYELPGALVHLRWEKSAGRWKVWASAAGVSVLLSTLETPDPQLVLRTSSENVDCLDLCFIPLPGPEPQRRNVSKAEDSVGVLGSPVETKV